MFSPIEISQILKSLIFGLRFDLAVASTIALISLFFSNSLRYMSLMSASLISALLLLQLGDLLYFAESARHISYEIVNISGDSKALFLTALSQHTAFIIIAILASIRLWFLLRSIFMKILTPIPIDIYYPFYLLILIIISIFFIRGMFAHIPLNPWQSSQIGNEKLATIALNGSYSALYALANSNKTISNRFTTEPNNATDTLLEIYKNSSDYNYKPLKRNIVIVFLESWSATHMKPYGSRVSATPFFDSLLDRSLRPLGAIAGGHRTTEGLFATLVSAQNPLGRSVAKTPLQEHNYHSLVEILNSNGYSSAFFQGTAKETSGTGAFVQSLGFAQSFGKEDIKTREFKENSWGVHDLDLYRFVLSKTDTLKEPFILGINNASTHDIELPDGIVAQKFDSDKMLNARLNILHFSDAALKQFVEQILKRYSDTLFVFVADHCGGGINSNFLNYLVPLSFYGKNITPRLIDEFVSQRDIAPTIIDLTLGDYRLIAPNFSGKSLLRDSNFTADYYHNGIHGWVRDKKTVEFNNNSTNCYDVSEFQPKAIKCDRGLLEYKNEYNAYTFISQKLLFDNSLDQFSRYRDEPQEEHTKE